ncbi:hypothetical protein TNCV_3762701 [Trichonephila clavipes]|nr:hypothetical protein TNCV_3762701 [Trichonephila clavipes]
MSMNRFTNAELEDILFIYDLPNGNVRIAVWEKISNKAATESLNIRLGTWEPSGTWIFLSHDRLHTRPF